MRKRYLAVLAILSAVACSAKYTIVPPAVDLIPLGTIGLVTLKAENAEGDLGDVSTQYFLQEVTAAQRVPVVELGPYDAVLAEAGRASFDRDALSAIAVRQGVDAIFLGEIQVSKVKPQVDLFAPLSKTLFARAAFDLAVKVRLVSAKNGATLWTNSAAREGTVGSVGMDGGVPVFSVQDKNEALNGLLRDIMYQLTWDFRPTRRRL